MAQGTANRLHELASQKEQELFKLREQQQKAVEVALKACQEELLEERRKRKILEDDFKYNLSLIEQRDHDLLRYETVLEEVKKAVNTRMGEMSDLRVQIDELQSKLDHAERDKGDLKKYYVQRLEQQQTHMDQYCKSKDNEVSQQRAEYERLQKQLQQRLLQVEEELAMEKQRMLSEKEDSLRTLEQEHRVKLDELTANILSKETHLRQLQRELSLVQNGAEQKHKDMTSMEEQVRELEKKLREIEWDHTDEVNTLQSRVVELEGQLSHAESTTKSIRTDFDNRRCELERLVREKESLVQSMKESHHQKVAEQERELGEVRARLEQAEVEYRRKEWNHIDEMKEKELQIEKLHGEILKLREECQRQVTQHSQELVQADLKMQSFQTSCEKIKKELTARIQDIERYKHELHLSSERERSIERSKAQMELDWQARLEDMERSQYGHQEELLKTLTSARDQSIVQCKKLESKLMEKVKVCESLRQERDIALDALQRKGLTDIAREILQGRGSSEVIETLQRQNQELREVIGHMRGEMERLAAPEDTHDDEQNGETNPQCKTNKGYVLYLESEVSRLQNESKKLKSSLAARKPPVPGGKKKRKAKNKEDPNIPPSLKSVLGDIQKEKATQEFEMAELRSHIRQLEATIKSQQHQAYIHKALQVPKDKIQEKLLQATKVIINLAEEKEELKKRESELKNKVDMLERQLKELEKEEEESDEDSLIIESIKESPHKISPPRAAYPITQSEKPLKSEHSTIQHPPTHYQVPPSYRTSAPKQCQDVKSAKTHSTSPQGSKLSLSPLKFSDSSFGSGLQAIQNLIDEVSPFLKEPSSPEEECPKSRGKENQKPNPLIVKGTQMAQSNREKVEPSIVRYKAPLRTKAQKPKVRNYNIKD